jgi:phosphopantetheine attachment domain protein
MENKVMRIIAEISEVNESEIRMESELVDDLEVDSMMSLEILTELERENLASRYQKQIWQILLPLETFLTS